MLFSPSAGLSWLGTLASLLVLILKDTAHRPFLNPILALITEASTWPHNGRQIWNMIYARQGGGGGVGWGVFAKGSTARVIETYLSSLSGQCCLDNADGKSQEL